MAEPTGTARQEAEKLVATVLAMASQAGLGGPPKDRDPAAPTGLTDMLSGFMDQVLGGNPPRGDADPGRSGEHPTDRRDDAASEGAGREEAEGAGRPGSTDAEDSQRGGERPGAAGPGGSAESGGFDWREAYQHTLDSLGAQARQAAGRQLWAGATRFGGWSTGSAECCACPICRAIAGVRNPTPEQAERLATGAGDFASGVASLLRAFSTVTGTTGTSTHRKPPPRPTTTPDQAWSAATRRAKPADTTPPDYEVRETDDPWTAATRAPRPEPAETPAARATAPEDPTVGTAAEQAATQTDATGPETTATEEPATAPSSRPGDPWAAATRTSRPSTRPRPAPTSRPARKNPTAASAEADAWVVTPGGSVSHPAPDAESADQEPQKKAEPAQGDPWAAATRSPGRAGKAAPGRPSTEAAPTAAAQPTTDPSGSTHAAPIQDPAAAVDHPSARTGKRPQETGTPTPSGPPPLPDNGPGSPRRVTGATDVWAAVTAANGDTAGDTGVAHTPSVDHDVPGTAPAAEAAEGRGAGSGDDARSGDAV
jgi:hypothetical protein